MVNGFSGPEFRYIGKDESNLLAKNLSVDH